MAGDCIDGLRGLTRRRLRLAVKRFCFTGNLHELAGGQLGFGNQGAHLTNFEIGGNLC